MWISLKNSGTCRKDAQHCEAEMRQPLISKHNTDRITSDKQSTDRARSLWMEHPFREGVHDRYSVDDAAFLIGVIPPPNAVRFREMYKFS